MKRHGGGTTRKGSLKKSLADWKSCKWSCKKRKPGAFRCKEHQNHPAQTKQRTRGSPCSPLVACGECCGRAQQRGQINTLFLANCLIISSWPVAANIYSPKQTPVKRGRGHRALLGRGGAAADVDLSRQELCPSTPRDSTGNQPGQGGQGLWEPGLGKASLPWHRVGLDGL